jgi:hypothetical protein|tara:strand:- start:2323 stop:2712 length:390 start_codon:yes stop_codon:yes gene_type:complete
MEKLTEETFLLYAAKNYDNPQLQNEEEFYDDLKKFKYIKRLFNKYAETGELKERLILNHIVVLTNVFGPDAAVKLLFLRLPEYLHYLKPFLLLLSILKDKIEVNNIEYITSDINIDDAIVERLRDIRNG